MNTVLSTRSPGISTVSHTPPPSSPPSENIQRDDLRRHADSIESIPQDIRPPRAIKFQIGGEVGRLDV
jgi:hypothetical protein